MWCGCFTGQQEQIKRSRSLFSYGKDHESDTISENPNQGLKRPQVWSSDSTFSSPERRNGSPLSFFQSKTSKQTKNSISKLKGILRLDDKCLLAEANEVRRLTDSSTWIEQPNSPMMSEMMETAKLSHAEDEIIVLCNEINRRIKASITDHWDLLKDLIANDFTVDVHRFKTDAAYREGIRSLHKAVNRFGCANVTRISNSMKLEKENKNSPREGSFRSPLQLNESSARGILQEDIETRQRLSNATETKFMTEVSTDKSKEQPLQFVKFPSSSSTESSSSASSSNRKYMKGVSIVGARIRNLSSSSPKSSFDSSSTSIPPPPLHSDSPRLKGRLASRTKMIGSGGSANSLLDTSINIRASIDSGVLSEAEVVDDISRVLTERTNSAYSAAELLEDLDDINVINTVKCLEKDSDDDDDDDDEDNDDNEEEDEEADEEEVEDDGKGGDDNETENDSLVQEVSIVKLPREQQLDALHVLPVCVFTADASITLAQIRKETGRPPLDQVECIRGVPKLADRADLVSRLSPPVAATVLLELKLRGSFQNIYECIKAEFRAPIKQELLSGKKYVLIHKTLPKDTALAIVKCSNSQDVCALLQAFENLTRATSLLAEIHRRGAADILLDDVAAKLPM